MAFATLIDSLDRHQGASTAILTAALVLVTAVYAWQNRKMVREMKHARDATILPKLALEFHRLGPNVVDLAIRNVGPGAAIEIDVRTEWVPTAEGATAPGATTTNGLQIEAAEGLEGLPRHLFNDEIETLLELDAAE